MVNKVFLVGRLGQNPDKRYRAGDTAVTKFTLATTKKWKDFNGKPQEKTQWHYIVAFSNLAELTHKFLSKGQLCSIEGSIEYDQYQCKSSGETKYITQIVISEFQSLEAPRHNGSQPANNPQYNQGGAV